MRLGFTCVCLLIVTMGASAQLNRTHFYGEDQFARTVPLTKSMIVGFRRDKNFGGCSEVAKSRVEVTKIDPNSDHRPEFLVKIPCGNSAASYYFWILSREKKSYRSIFFVATMGIDFTKSRRSGYRGIAAAGCNANTCFHETFVFDGQRYKRNRRWTRPNS